MRWMTWRAISGRPYTEEGEEQGGEGEIIVPIDRLQVVGLGRYCPPHHPTRFEPSVIILNATL